MDCAPLANTTTTVDFAPANNSDIDRWFKRQDNYSGGGNEILTGMDINTNTRPWLLPGLNRYRYFGIGIFFKKFATF